MNRIAQVSMTGLIHAGKVAALTGADQYLRAHNLMADSNSLADCLNSWIKARLPEALHDARQAIDCGMEQVAIATFNASMVLAGIEAAKEASLPPTSPGA